MEINTNMDHKTDSFSDSNERLMSRQTTDALASSNTKTQGDRDNTSNLAHEDISTTPASAHENNMEIGLEPDMSLLRVYEDLMANKEMDEVSGLSMLTVQEKVQVDLLRTLQRLKAPLITFQEVLQCAKFKDTSSEIPPPNKRFLSPRS
jgi:hypothetical protein